MRTALIVDDSNVVRVSLTTILSNLGFTCLKAQDGKDALEVFEKNKEDISVILLDWNMPIMNGYDFLLELRKNYPQEPKVLMVTTEIQMKSMLKALAGGADEYVMKPFDKNIIRDKLEILGFYE